MSKEFAKVSYCAEDIIGWSEVTESWSEEKAEAWLQENQKHIQAAMSEAAWEAINTLLGYEESV